MKFDGVGQTGYMAVYDPVTRQQVGAVYSGSLGSAATIRYLRIGGYAEHGEFPSCYTFYDSWAIDVTNVAFPLLPKLK
jgi:hypothetical protein